MAGSNPGFNPSAFRTAIRFAMEMGTPQAVSERATFQWPVEKTFVVADTMNKPYNWGAAPTSEVIKPDVQVLCAVEFSGNGAFDGTAMGDFEKATAALTLLDEEYEKVIGATRVLLGGNTYEVLYTAPPVGMFETTVYTIYCEAVDES